MIMYNTDRYSPLKTPFLAETAPTTTGGTLERPVVDRSKSNFERRTTALSASFALVSSALGAGLFTLPYAMSRTGLLPGVALLACSCGISAVTTWVLIDATLRRPGVRSYGALAASAIGLRWGVVADTFLSGNGAISVPLLLIFQVDFITGVLRQLLGDSRLYATAKFRLPLLLLLAASAIPLAVRKRYGALSYATVPYVFVLLCAGVAAACKAAGYHGRLTAADHVRWLTPRDLPSVLASFNVFQFVFMHHQNVPAICHDLVESRDARKVALFSGLAEFVIYLLISCSGYWAFGGRTAQDFLLGYDTDDAVIFALRVILCIALTIALPMVLISTASASRRLTKRLRGRRESWGRQRSRRMASVGSHLLLGILIAGWTDQAGKVVSVLGGLVATSLLLAIPAMMVKNNTLLRSALRSLSVLGYVACIVAALRQ